MRIDHNGIGFARRIESRARFGAEIFREREVAAISRVGMNAKAEAIAEAQNFGQRVDRAGSGCSERRDDAANVSARGPAFESGAIKTSTSVCRDRFERQFEDTADSLRVCSARRMRSTAVRFSFAV